MTDQPKPPLWQTMYEAAAEASDACSDADNTDGAAMIRALADWLVPEEEEPEHIIQFNPDTLQHDSHAWDEWRVSKKLRQLLLTEADRAERGD